MKNNKEIWFVTGSQSLYGDDVLDQVKTHATEIAVYIDQHTQSPAKISCGPILTRSEEIYQLCLKANADSNCIGLIFWMHTFSPAQMWIKGLKELKKPFLHLHTQFNRDIPWKEINMDFMNLNQSAHGDREFGFVCSNMYLERAVLAGHWKDPELLIDIQDWVRAALGWNESQNLKVARLGDNMRNVAVTEGNKVSARMRFGWSVEGYGIGELTSQLKEVSPMQIQELIEEYKETYVIEKHLLTDTNFLKRLADAAQIEIALKAFLDEGGFKAFTTTFEDLNGLKQLPGIAVQRLMHLGYGFGAEGDWKTAALLRCMKVMEQGLQQGTSFMEDYTYHLDPARMFVLGAHMLEVCPSIATSTPSLEIHPLSIGGKDDPARLVFNARAGNALNATLIDLGHRFRLLVNTVEAVEPNDLPNLPVARALWTPQPNLKTATAAWIMAGGAHHTGFSFSVKPMHLKYFAQMADVEYITIDHDTKLDDFDNKLKWNEMYYQFLKK